MNVITRRDIAHAAFAFIADAADAIHESYWFSLRGECEASLCTHTMLTMDVDEFCRVMYILTLFKLESMALRYHPTNGESSYAKNNFSLMAM
jgi:hypothetical protein